MKNISLIILAALMLAGCDSSYSNKDGNYKLPPELKSCHIYKLRGDKANATLNVLVCPNSTTTTQYSVDDGDKYHQEYNTTVINQGND